MLRGQKYGLRSHHKVLHTGKIHTERDQQFRHISAQREDFRSSGEPRISVDTKKKELVGQFKNNGQTWCQEGEKVNDHDFPSDASGRAAPYGVYDPERNEGHVCVTTSSDTADLAVDAVRDWWRLNQPHYPQAKRLMIEADIVAAAMERVRGGTRKVCRTLPMRPGSKLQSASTRLEHPNGIRLSTDSSARSQPHGLAMSCALC